MTGIPANDSRLGESDVIAEQAALHLALNAFSTTVIAGRVAQATDQRTAIALPRFMDSPVSD
jgi:hypothetical protein